MSGGFHPPRETVVGKTHRGSPKRAIASGVSLHVRKTRFDASFGRGAVALQSEEKGRRWCCVCPRAVVCAPPTSLQEIVAPIDQYNIH